MFLKIWQYYQKTPALEFLFDKVVGLLFKDIFIKKEIPPTQVFSCKYCEIINNFFKEHLLVIILFQNFIW